MRGRHEEVGGRGAFSAAVLAVFCILPMPLSVGAGPLQPLGDTLAAQADDTVEQVEAPTSTRLASADLDGRVVGALLDDRVNLQDPEDDDDAKHYAPHAFVEPLRAHPVPHVSRASRGPRFPFRLRAFAGRAPPAA